MAKVTLSGASDDLIELDGDLLEEWEGVGADEEPIFVGFSDGTLASVRFGVDGSYWRINVLWRGTATITHEPATDEDDDYSDKLTLEGDIAWVVCGSDKAQMRKGARSAKVEG